MAVRRTHRRAAAALAIALLTLAGAGTASAQRVTLRDDAGRPIRFDLRVPGVDPAPYADVLRRAAHGAEIARVVVRITTPRAVAQSCGDDAEACYGPEPGEPGPVIVLPSRGVADWQHTLLHEYGHHVDHNVRTPHWWRERRISLRLARCQVATDYSRGWDHAVGEIFAEDYVQLHVVLAADYAIDWLPAPGRRVRAALRRDLAGLAAPPRPPASPRLPASPPGPGGAPVSGPATRPPAPVAAYAGGR